MKASIDRFTRIEDLPKLVSVDEAALWMGVSPWLLYEAVKRRDLACARLGRRVLIPLFRTTRLARRVNLRRAVRLARDKPASVLSAVSLITACQSYPVIAKWREAHEFTKQNYLIHLRDLRGIVLVVMRRDVRWPWS